MNQTLKVLCILAPLFVGAGHTVFRSPAPFVTAVAVQRPTPYPTPREDLKPYLHEQGGAVVTVAGSEDLGFAVNEADRRLGASPGKIVVRGGGSIKTQIVVSHDLTFQSGVYSCETKTPWQGCILLKNNVKAEGVGDVTILEPTHSEGGVPAITVFQTYTSAQSNESASQRITVKGFRIRGRQKIVDGGTRQSISFGNCSTCAAIANTLEGVASIGIQFGGAATAGNHARNCVATGNTIIASVAAGIAVVNATDVRVYGNTILRPGRANGPGGVSGVDIETNNIDDWCENIKIYNNRIDYQGSAIGAAAGSAILAQNVYKSLRSGGLLIANNAITGGPPTVQNTSLSNGIFFTGAFPGGMVINNTIRNAKQSGLQLYGSEGVTFQDLELESCGGGGIPAVLIVGGGGNRFIRLNIYTPPGAQVNTWPAIMETQGTKNNVFQGNSVPAQKG
ncbi:MAG: right-handed parallel beta-helix repeat-containing protein [Rubrivivax sp.]|nr:right-handed parallel beta-helix repeat-containing protein [Pyrinomonadaceae bacterium]